jgi:hypothetical protein
MTKTSEEEDHGCAHTVDRVPEPGSVVLSVTLIIRVGWQGRTFGLKPFKIVIMDVQHQLHADVIMELSASSFIRI